MAGVADTLIPKILHYVWLGGGPLPPRFVEFRAGWQRLHPDWQIIEWNEQRFDVASHPFVARCQAERRYAFASDYLRLHALATQGGFYLDTDVELFRSLEPFRSAGTCWGFEFDCYLSTSLIGAQPGHPLIHELIGLYDQMAELVVSNSVITRFFLQRYAEFQLTGESQVLSDGTHLFPKDMFVVPSHHPDRNVARHWGDYSWGVRGQGPVQMVKRWIRRGLGDATYFRLVNWRINQRNEFAPVRRAHLARRRHETGTRPRP